MAMARLQDELLDLHKIWFLSQINVMSLFVLNLSPLLSVGTFRLFILIYIYNFFSIIFLSVFLKKNNLLYRVEYKQLDKLRDILVNVPFIGLTATATEK